MFILLPQRTHVGPKTEELVGKKISRQERITRLSKKERMNESQAQCRRLKGIRNDLTYLAEHCGGDILFCSSFPNFKHRTVQICTAGRGKSFLQTRYGKYLEDQWKKSTNEVEPNDGWNKQLWKVLLHLLTFFETNFVFTESEENSRNRNKLDGPVCSQEPVSCSKQPAKQSQFDTGIMSFSISDWTFICCKFFWLKESHRRSSKGKSLVGYPNQHKSSKTPYANQLQQSQNQSGIVFIALKFLDYMVNSFKWM